LGKPKEAVAHYYLALRSSKQTEELLLKTARLELYELNQIKHAVENFERVLQINPKNPEAHYRLGFALKDLDQLERAKAEFNTYLELAPDGEFAKEVQGELLNLKD
jgi:Flp pilus assembly protein TadD